MAQNTLLNALKRDYPDFTFKSGKRFSFKPEKTIIFGPSEPFSELLILHELGHALSKKYTYKTHIERLKIESLAWQKAKEIYDHYKNIEPDLIKVAWSQDFIEDNLDTYRNWLHTKSLCKKCGLTRYQSDDGAYHCPHCDLFT